MAKDDQLVSADAAVRDLVGQFRRSIEDEAEQLIPTLDPPPAERELRLMRDLIEWQVKWYSDGLVHKVAASIPRVDETLN